MAENLTSGAISMITSGEYKEMDLKPVLQVVDIRLIQTQNQSGENKGDRYRLLLSDGSSHQQGMLATQRNDLVTSQQLQKGSIIQLTEFMCNTIRERLLVIILDLIVIMGQCDIIDDVKPFLQKLPGGETPSMARPAAPMQSSFNQQPTTFNDARPHNQGPPSGSVIHPHSNDITGDVKPFPQKLPGAKAPPMARPAAPMQSSFNQQATTFGDARFSNQGPPSGSVIRPHSNVGPPFHTPENNSTHSALPQPTENNRMPPVQPPHNRPPPMYGNRGPVAKNEAAPRTMPIAALNPYQGRWTIKARVTSKGELRRYNNAKGDGKVFSFDLLDSLGGEIRATCFNAVADNFYNQIEVGKVYYLSKGTLKPAQKAFNHLKNDFEITLDHTSTAQPCLVDDDSIPRQQFNFRPISEVEDMENNTVLDVIGVVTSVNPASSIMRKNGVEAQKRSLFLKDMSGRSIELTLWGDLCNKEGQTLQEMSDSGVFPILAVKSARAYDFNGKTLSTLSSSQLSINPDFPEAQKLKIWFDSVGKNTPSVSMSRDSALRTDLWKTITQIKDEKLGTSEKPDYITVNATIWQIKLENFCYTACPIMTGERRCSKKVVDNGDGKYKCEKCDQVVDECEYRYILQLHIYDHTGSTWITAFQETGEEIMGISAKDLFDMQNEQDDKFTETVRSVLHNEYSFKLKVKEETWGDAQRVKSSVVKVEKIKFSSNTKIRLLDIQKMQESTGLSSGADQTAPSGIRQQGVLPANQVSHFGNQYRGVNSGVP